MPSLPGRNLAACHPFPLAMLVLALVAACAGRGTGQGPDAAGRDACRGKAVLTARSCPGDELSAEEKELIALVNRYRRAHKLPEVAASPSLALVANRHVRDLSDNVGRLSHGWSDCPYDAGKRATYPCMWDAPKRFHTPYPSHGFENAHMASNGATARSAFDGWKHSHFHNDVLLSQGNFEGYRWRAIGVAIYGQYAVLWVGRDPDPRAR